MQVRVGDVRLFFDVEGAGLVVDDPSMRQRPTLVLLHGGPGFDHTVFRPSYSQLADTAQVVYLDLRDPGRSDRGDPSRRTVDVWAEDVRGFCDAVDIKHPVMLGWSAGGTVAMAYAARYPGHPANSCCSRQWRDSTSTGSSNGSAGLAAAKPLKLPANSGRPVAQKPWPPTGPSARPCTAPVRAIRTSFLASSSILDFQRPGRGHARSQPPAQLASVTCPTLVVVGDLDPVCTVEAAKEIVVALPANLVRFERFAHAGHHIHRDHPEASSRSCAISFWMRRHSTAGPDRWRVAEEIPLRRGRLGGGVDTHDAVLKPDTPAMMLEPRRPCRGRTRRNPPRSDSQIFLVPGDRIGVMVFANGAKRGTHWLTPEVSAQRPETWNALRGWYRGSRPTPQIQPSSSSGREPRLPPGTGNS